MALSERQACVQCKRPIGRPSIVGATFHLSWDQDFEFPACEDCYNDEMEHLHPEDDQDFDYPAEYPAIRRAALEQHERKVEG